jgi:hypothetical protein
MDFINDRRQALSGKAGEGFTSEVLEEAKSGKLSRMEMRQAHPINEK